MHSIAASGSDVTTLLCVTLPGQCDASDSGSGGGGRPTASGATLLLAGCGSQLHAYALPSGARCAAATVLPNAARVHGLACLAQTRADGRPTLLLAAHGGRHAALVRLLGPPPGAAGGGPWEVVQVADLPRFECWTMCVTLSWQSSSGGDDGSLLLALGLSDNSLQAFSVQLGNDSSIGSSSRSDGVGGGGGGTITPVAPAAAVTHVLHAACSESSLLYSMCLHQRTSSSAGERTRGSSSSSTFDSGSRNSSSSSGGGGWLVAGGTICHEVLVWAAQPPAGLAAAACGGSAALVPPPPAVCQPLMRLGHEGSIHR